ncbi:DUF2235 domain-containing protein [Tardiphaga sp. 20_F10_N6_6]|jgi:uncharacterized protein (DUF2235 family)|uniref:DUF2235 domain-containing protein n=1 Tax=unclassified Tardiphaga TaxID=2631404 RepID=UPI003F1EB460
MEDMNARQKAKRIAVFLDGTWNTVHDNTNVWRLRALTAPIGSDGVEQKIFYNSGLGTRTGQKISGGMFGIGIDDILLDAYEWLVENYNNGDQLFIFGFSRGSFTARSLSGFISKCGLLTPGAPLSTNQLYGRYRLGLNAVTIDHLLNHPPEEPTLEEQWVVKYSRSIPVRFLGVFDTVGSLGNPSPISRFRRRHQFLNTGLRVSNTSAAHALAIDEHRPDFPPTLWTRSVPKEKDAMQPRAVRTLDEAEQRWFVGAHANVGGGYASDLLAQEPLAWMMKKAAAKGLSFRQDVDHFPEFLKSPVIDSYGSFLGGVYKIFRTRFDRTIGADPIDAPAETESTINETIDASVFERWRTDSSYRPRSLTEWVDRKKIDLSSITTSIRAEDPTLTVT